jgi:hypothetical protein
MHPGIRIMNARLKDPKRTPKTIAPAIRDGSCEGCGGIACGEEVEGEVCTYAMHLCEDWRGALVHMIYALMYERQILKVEEWVKCTLPK